MDYFTKKAEQNSDSSPYGFQQSGNENNNNTDSIRGNRDAVDISREGWITQQLKIVEDNDSSGTSERGTDDNDDDDESTSTGSNDTLIAET